MVPSFDFFCGMCRWRGKVHGTIIALDALGVGKAEAGAWVYYLCILRFGGLGYGLEFDCGCDDACQRAGVLLKSHGGRMLILETG
jgi:hypothetical protein